MSLGHISPYMDEIDRHKDWRSQALVLLTGLSPFYPYNFQGRNGRGGRRGVNSVAFKYLQDR